MSELRDQIEVEQAISDSITALERYVAQSVADTEQLRLGLHDLRGQIASVLLEREEAFRALDQIQSFMADFSRQMVEFNQRQENTQIIVTDGFRALNKRIGNAERAVGIDEVTQA